VNVSAKDLGTGKEQAITITASTNLSKDEVDRMFETALAGEGVKSVSLRGQRFDPKLAEAIATQPAPDGTDEDTVLEEPCKAYTIGDEVLRPAQVVVAKAREL
jgi:molecular chaperone GrpE (heat shock protein)